MGSIPITRSRFLLLLFPLLAFAASAHSKSIPLPAKVSQGQYVDIRFEISAAEDPVSLQFLGSTVPCHRLPDSPSVRCLAAVQADAPTGRQPLVIRSVLETVLRGSVEVRASSYPVLALRLTKDLKSLEDSDDDVRKIRASLRRETPDRAWKGPFLKPVEGPVESDYGERRTVDGQMRPGFHRGVDWGAPEGTPIRAAHDGVVTVSAHFPEEGNMVAVDHGQGVATAYLHASKLIAREGQLVRKGDEIALVGTTGVSNTSHLHFGVYIHGKPVDPVYWISTQR